MSGMPGVLPQIGRVKLNLDMSNARASALSLSIRGIVTVRLESGHPHSSLNSNRVSEPSTQGLLSARSWVNKGQGAMPMPFPLAQPPPFPLAQPPPWPDFDRARE